MLMFLVTNLECFVQKEKAIEVFNEISYNLSRNEQNLCAFNITTLTNTLTK